MNWRDNFTDDEMGFILWALDYYRLAENKQDYVDCVEILAKLAELLENHEKMNRDPVKQWRESHRPEIVPCQGDKDEIPSAL